MLSKTQNFVLVAIWGLCCLFASSPTLAEKAPDEIALQPGYGYLLIRVIGRSGERVVRLEMTNLDTGYVIKTNSRMYKSAGLYAWMCLVAVPEGRYFVSKYAPSYGDYYAGWFNGKSIRLEAPSSASDTFEIAPRVVNYVGDWTMRVVSSRRMQLDTNIEFDKSTLERYLTQYPQYSNKYEIYLSVMGQEAISLAELAKTTEE